MKLNKQFVCVVSICMVTMLTACSTGKTTMLSTTEKIDGKTTMLSTTATDKKLSLSDKGMSLINEVATLAKCEEYISLYSANQEIASIIKNIAEVDYTKPNAVFVMENLDKAMFENILAEAKLPTEVEKILKNRVAATFPSQINAMSGATTLAATSILSHNDSFIYEGLETITTYLYTFDKGYSFMVTFIPDDENIVTGIVNMVVNDEIANCKTAAEVTDFFKKSIGNDKVDVSVATEQK